MLVLGSMVILFVNLFSEHVCPNRCACNALCFSFNLAFIYYLFGEIHVPIAYKIYKHLDSLNRKVRLMYNLIIYSSNIGHLLVIHIRNEIHVFYIKDQLLCYVEFALCRLKWYVFEGKIIYIYMYVCILNIKKIIFI